MKTIHLLKDEVSAVQSLATEAASRYGSTQEPEFWRDVTVIAHEIPRRVRAFFNDFRQHESTGVIMVTGHEINDSALGSTPSHWRRVTVAKEPREEMLLALYGSLLGDVIGWSTQQGGRIIHDILPIKEHENTQISTGSEQEILWHTEDAFDEYMGDYVGFLCLRNPREAASTFATVDIERTELPAHVINTLFEPRFVARPDESRLEELGAGAQNNSLQQAAYERIQRLMANPEKVAVLHGDRQRPYVRIDMYFVSAPDHDAEAKDALAAFARAVDALLFEVVLRPGDVCFVDNLRAVHGRKPFKAFYDGKDRWLKRLCTTRDLRKSRSVRASAASRLIYS